MEATIPPDQTLIDDARTAATRRDLVPHRNLALVSALALVLLMGATLSWPTIAETWMEQYNPKQVSSLPPAAPAEVTNVPAPTAARWESLESIEAQVGFTPLVPGYLPPGCVTYEQFGWSREGLVALNFNCPADVRSREGKRVRFRFNMGLMEQKGEISPYVGKGPVERLTIGGRHAVYSTGAWMQREGEEETVWVEDSGQELAIESDGVVITISGPPAFVMPKAELIRMAQSLRPAD
jgi:hypothetical protein